MIDRDLDTEADRELHSRFLDVYRDHLSQVTLWPPMDVYELFWRLGRVDDLFVPGEQNVNPQSETLTPKSPS